MAVHGADERVVGMTSSLIIRWDHYDMFDNWDDFTANGMLTNHDAVNGHTLYGVEAIVDPALQGHGLGHKIVRDTEGPDPAPGSVADARRRPPARLPPLRARR